MNKKKKLSKNEKLKKNKTFIFILIIIIISIAICLYSKNDYKLINNISSDLKNINYNMGYNSEYKTIKQDINQNYHGIGQQQIKNEDGYFTIFTTAETNKKTYKEYKQNGDSSWSNKEYWGGSMADNGCGITAIATILSGYRQSYTPEDLRKKYYPVLNSTIISQELSKTFGIKNTDFYYDSLSLSKDKLQKHLETNRPILICVWDNPTDNRWTTASHYMVLLATDGDDMVYISNPNGLENNSKSSGWYNFDEVVPFIAKALYIKSYT